MKKAVIAAAALAAAAGISIGAFFAVKNKSENEAAEEAEKLSDLSLFSIDSDSISSIAISSPDGDFSFVLENEKWVNAEGSGNSFALNQETIQGICTAFSQLSADTSYGEANNESKAKYGLSAPYIITVGSGTDEHTLYIGDVSPTGDYYYAAADERNSIYAILAEDAESLITTRLELLDDNFIPYDDGDVSEMIVKKDGKVVYDIAYNTEKGLWELPEKYRMLTVNQTRPATTLTLITRLTAEQMLDENLSDLSVYGFDEPDAEFTVKAFDGTERTILIKNPVSGNSTYSTVLMTDTNQVELYYTADMKFANYTIFDLVMQIVESENIYNVSEFSFSCDEAEDAFTVNMAENTAECRGTAIDLEKAEINSMFTSFYNIFSYISISDIDIEAEPELKDPLFSARYTTNDGAEKSIDLVPVSSGSDCYVFADGVYTGTLTSPDFISGSNSMMSAYELLCQHTGIEPNLKN